MHDVVFHGVRVGEAETETMAELAVQILDWWAERCGNYRDYDDRDAIGLGLGEITAYERVLGLLGIHVRSRLLPHPRREQIMILDQDGHAIWEEIF